MAISVTLPISPAFERAKLMTFRPFDLGRWFVLGFIAFLASLGQVGGFNSGGQWNTGAGRRTPIPVPGPPGQLQQLPSPTDLGQDAWHWILANGVFALFIVAVIAVVVLGFAMLLLWLSSRGKFMFLRAIATNTTQVVTPWREYRDLANNLFVFRASLLLAAALANFAIVVLAVIVAWQDIRAETFGIRAAAAIVLAIVLWVPSMLVLSLIGWCTDQFVTTIMYARSCSVREAWRDFGQNVMSGHVSMLVLFLLVRILMKLALVLAHVVIGCATCCIGFLPYLGTVATLPLVVFLRCYSIYFLEQFGSQYVIIQEAPPPPAFPVGHAY